MLCTLKKKRSIIDITNIHKNRVDNFDHFPADLSILFKMMVKAEASPPYTASGANLIVHIHKEPLQLHKAFASIDILTW